MADSDVLDEGSSRTMAIKSGLVVKFRRLKHVDQKTPKPTVSNACSLDRVFQATSPAEHGSLDSELDPDC